jgi:TP901 family phage tail tape measure protein
MAFVLNAELALNVNKAQLASAKRQIDSGLKSTSVDIRARVSPQAVRSTQRLTTSLKDIKKEARASSDAIEEFGRRISLAGKRYLAFSLATVGVVRGLAALREGFSNVVDFERQIVKIGQVSGRSLQQLSGLRQEILATTAQLGVDSQEIAQSAVTLAQTGRPLAEIRKDLEAISKARLAPTFGSAQQTVEGLIAVQNQFGRTAGTTEEILSKLNTVAGKFPVEAGDLTTAIQKAGGAFDAAGGSLEELLALFTAIRATTRESADTIGTSFRTITGRLARVDTREFIKRNLGLDLVQDGQLLTPFEAILDISREIQRQGISERSPLFAQIVEQLGGIRQRAKVIPLLRETAKAEQVLNAIRSGGNSISRDAEVAQESLAVQIQSVREEFRKFIDNVLQDPAFRSFAGQLLDITKGLIRIADATRPLIPLFGLLGTVFAGRALIGGTAGKFASSIIGNPSQFNLGGVVPGVGTRDTVPALLRPGEVVLNPIQQRRLGDLTGQSPLDLFRASGVPGFQGGGAIPGADRGLFARRTELQTLIALLNKETAKLGSGRGMNPIEFSKEARRLSEATGNAKRELNQIEKGIKAFEDGLESATTATKKQATETVKQTKASKPLTALLGQKTIKDEGLALFQKPKDTGLRAQLGTSVKTDKSLFEESIGLPKPFVKPQNRAVSPSLFQRARSGVGRLGGSGLAAFGGIAGAGILSSDIVNNEQFQQFAASAGATAVQVGVLNSALKQSAPILAVRQKIEDQTAKRQVTINKLANNAQDRAQARSALAKASASNNQKLFQAESARFAALRDQRAELIKVGKAESNRLRGLNKSLQSQQRFGLGVSAGVGAAGLAGGILSNVGQGRLSTGDSSGVGLSAAGGALSGAATGAGIGALFGPVGIGVGAAGGALVGFALSLDSARQSLINFSKEQVKAFQELSKGQNQIDFGAKDLRESLAKLRAVDASSVTVNVPGLGLRRQATAGRFRIGGGFLNTGGNELLKRTSAAIRSKEQGRGLRAGLENQFKFFDDFDDFSTEANEVIKKAAKLSNIEFDLFLSGLRKGFDESKKVEKTLASGQIQINKSLEQLSVFLAEVGERVDGAQGIRNRLSFLSGGQLGQESFQNRFSNISRLSAGARGAVNQRGVGLANIFGSDQGDQFKRFSEFIPTARAFAERIQSLGKIDQDILDKEFEKFTQGQDTDLKEIFNKGVTNFFKLQGDNKLDVSDLGLDQIFQGTTGDIQQFLQGFSQLNQIFERQISELDANLAKERRLREQLSQGRLNLVNIRQQGSDIISRLTGSRQAGGFDAQRARAITGGLNARQLGANLRGAQDRLLQVNARRDALGPNAGVDQLVELSRQRSIEIQNINNASNALKFLTDVTGRSAEAQRRFTQAQQDRLAKAGLLEPIAAGTPQEARQRIRDLTATQALSKGQIQASDLNGEQFRRILGLARGVGDAQLGSTGKTGTQFAQDILAQRAEVEFAKQGIDPKLASVFNTPSAAEQKELQNVQQLTKEAGDAQRELNTILGQQIIDFAQGSREAFEAAFSEIKAEKVIIQAAEIEGGRERDQFNQQLAEAISAFPEQVNLNGGSFLSEIEGNIRDIATGIVREQMDKLTSQLNIQRIS